MNQITNFLFGSAPPQYESLWAYTNRVGFLNPQNKWPTVSLWMTALALVALHPRDPDAKISISGSIATLTAMLLVDHCVEYFLCAQPCNFVQSKCKVLCNGAAPVSINITRDAVYIPEADEQTIMNDNKQ